MSESKVYDAKDIFEEIPGDPDNVMMKIPPEVYEKLDWDEGTVLKITIQDGAIVLTKHE